jgi:hypothetical protein
MAHCNKIPTMKKILLLLTIFLFIKFNCFADEQRLRTRFQSNNGKYSIQYKNKRWVVSNSEGSMLYKIRDKGYTSMTIFLSDNGQNVIVIDDFMEGHLIKDRSVLWIFDNGELKNSYQLTKLLKDTCNVTQSIWHTTWCLDDYGFNKTQKVFSVSTNEFIDYSFDLNSGLIISSKRPENYDDSTLILYGEFRKNSSDQVTMKILRYISGDRQPEDKIIFKTDYFGSGFWTEGVMIKNGVDITPEKYRHQIMINSWCIYKKNNVP